MKFSTIEEYGLRCLIRIAKSKSRNGMTIPEISVAEGLSQAHAGKILRMLRLGGFIESERGQTGGYKLTRKPDEIIVHDVLIALGGKLFDASFCQDHTGTQDICYHSVDCSVRSLWGTLQKMIDAVLVKVTLKDLMGNENESTGNLTLIADSVIEEQAKSYEIPVIQNPEVLRRHI